MVVDRGGGGGKGFGYGRFVSVRVHVVKRIVDLRCSCMIESDICTGGMAVEISFDLTRKRAGKYASNIKELHMFLPT